MVSKDASTSLVVFALGEHRFALSMAVVERVVRAVEVTPVPDAPLGIIGVVNVHGRIIPVLNIRPRFGLPSREIEVSDHLVIAHVGDRQVAVLVDAAVDVVEAGEAASPMLSMDALAGIGSAGGVMMHGEEIVPVQDLSRFLPPASAKAFELKLVA